MLAVLVAAVLFGTTGTAQALGPDGTTPLSVGVMRLVIGGTALAVIGFGLSGLAERRRRSAAARGIRTDPPAPRLTGSAIGLMVVTGLCLAVYQPLFFFGTARSGVAVGTVIALGSAPVIAGVLEWLVTRVAPTRRWMLATALATVGVLVLAVAGGGAAGVDVIGILASVGAGASFAVLAIAQRRLIDRGYRAFTVSGAMGAVAAACAMVALPFVDVSWLGEPSGMVMALWLGLVTVGVAYTLFTWSLQRLSAATAATLTLGEPLTAGLLGLLVLGERLSFAAGVGLAILAAGLLLLTSPAAARGRRVRGRGRAARG